MPHAVAVRTTSAPPCGPIYRQCQFFKPLPDLRTFLVTGQAVFQLHILPGCEFLKQTEFPETACSRERFPDFYPAGYGNVPDIFSIKGQDALIVFPVSINKTAQRRFSGTRSSFYQIFLSFLEGQLTMPDIRSDAVIAGKYFRQDLLEFNDMHGQLFIRFMVCTATSAAVSVRRRDLPRLTARKPFSSALATSSGLKSPSGPISTRASSPGTSTSFSRGFSPHSSEQ